ncbi:MAG: 16S rRNA (guanine(527)-N(7))-methyltransferase RsmG [Bacteroidales bacterium]|nr:16S rRNA (guanine(527)-N(7))-methyltransferase RsmG [Bacteroidales bacterium]MBQ9722064.1 16S rRNA (guanine(527)-N(7))-methyltransferase RsmG [Bacteroidales bacterium]
MEYSEFKKIIEEKFPEVTERQMEQFEKMDTLYRDWNSKINVVSRKDIDELYRHHVLHSLGIAAYLKTEMPDVYDRLRGEGPFSIAEPLKVMDLGTGGGFPGIPLAVMFPHAQFTLCDSIGKKIIVATEVAKGLGLENVKTVNARAESLPETFDYIVSRAVTALDNFMPWVKGKYSEGILYLKGGDLEEEIARAKLRKGSVHVWPISGWTSDPFFETKQVIFIEK